MAVRTRSGLITPTAAGLRRRDGQCQQDTLSRARLHLRQPDRGADAGRLGDVADARVGPRGQRALPATVGRLQPRPADALDQTAAEHPAPESRHEDNPTLYDEHGQITERGRRTLAVLDSLTGVRYQRLRLGKWVAAEAWSTRPSTARVHLVDRFPIPAEWWRMRAIDFGYNNPFVCLADRGGPRRAAVRVPRDLCMTGRTVEAHAAQIKALSEGERIRFTVADHDAEDRATLAAKGIPTLPATKAISPGIQAIQDRLKRGGWQAAPVPTAR